MKKRGLLIMALSLMTLTACGNTTKNETLSSETNTMCKDAIQTYLENANNPGEGIVIKNGHNITVNYIGRLDESTVFDTNIPEIAEACGKTRPSYEGLNFPVGEGRMIAGFDKGVIGMKIGETKTIEIPAIEAYGEHNSELVITHPIIEVPNADQYKEGMQVSNGMQVFTITKITKEEITFDANHELAGKDLIFDITITDIKE